MNKVIFEKAKLLRQKLAEANSLSDPNLQSLLAYADDLVDSMDTCKPKADIGVVASDLNEEIFCRFMDKLPAAVFAHDMDGNIILVNDMSCKLTGYTSEELLGMNVADLDPVAPSGNSQREFWESLFSAKSITINATHRHKTGHHYSVDVHMTAMRLSGAPVILGIALNTTEREQMIAELKQRERLQRSIVTTTPESFWMVDKLSRITEANEAFVRLMGYSREELLTMSVNDIDVIEGRKETRQRIKKLIIKGYDQFETVLRHKSGEKIDVEMSISFLGDDIGRFVCFGRDITDRKRLEQEKGVTLKLLGYLNKSMGQEQLIKDVTTILQEWSGCQAVGIRVKEGEDYPYYVIKGLGEEFSKSGNSLCDKDHNGEIIRDKTGEPQMSCLCGQIIQERLDTKLPVVTMYGSFWTNSVSELERMKEYKGPLPGDRSQCQAFGYESVALVPLKVSGKTLGLLQFNDERKNRFNKKKILIYERLAANLAIGLLQRETAEMLRESEEKFRRIYENMAIGVAMVSLKFRIFSANHAYCNMIGYTEEELVGKHLRDITQPEVVEENIRLQASLGLGEIEHYRMEKSFIHKNGSVRHGILDANLVRNIEGQPEYFIGTVVDITEKKEAEHALRESEELLMALFMGSTDPIAICDLKDNVIDINPAFEKLFEYSAIDIIGSPFPGIVRSDKYKWDKWLSICRSGEGISSYDTIRKSKSGREIPVCISISPIFAPGGELKALSFWYRDISQRTKIEQELRNSQERFRIVSELSSDYAYCHRVTDKGLEPVWSIGAFKKITGFSPKELYEMGGMAKLIHPDDIEQAQLYAETLLSGRESSITLRIKNKSGEIKYIQDNGKPWIDKTTKKILGTYGAAKDITKQVVAEQAVRQSENNLKIVLENLPGAVFGHDLDGMLIIVNEMSSITTGYSRKELLTMNVKDIDPESISRADREKLWHGLKPGQSVMIESTHKRKDHSEYIAEIHLSAVKINDKEIVLAIVTDITEKKKAQKELQRISKLESLGILAGGIAHNFNNILASMGMSIEIARHKPGQLNIHLDKLSRSIELAAQLASKFQAFTKGGEPILNPVNINELLEESADFSVAGSGAVVRFKLDRDIPPIFGDTTQLHEVFTNILINATQAMPRGGSIYINSSVRELDESNTIGLDSGEYVKISIRDEGVGISKANLQEIFTPFFTTKDSGKGLGLATVFQIVRKHNGTITVKSEINIGTEFEVYLPLQRGLTENTFEAANETISLGSEEIKILLIDDNEELTDNMCDLSEILDNIIIECFNDPREGIKDFRTHFYSSPYDVVILDLTLEGYGISGLDVLGELREIDTQIRVIVFSGHSTKPVVANYRQYGFNGRLEKPCKIDKLQEVVREVLDRN